MPSQSHHEGLGLTSDPRATDLLHRTFPQLRQYSRHAAASLKPCLTALGSVEPFLRQLARDLEEEEKSMVTQMFMWAGFRRYTSAQAILSTTAHLVEVQRQVSGALTHWEDLIREVKQSDSVAQTALCKRLFAPLRSSDPKDASWYDRFLLEALADCRGEGKSETLIDTVGDKVATKLGLLHGRHFELTFSVPNWRSLVHAARGRLVGRGYMRPSEHRGVWQISEEGLKQLWRLQKKDMADELRVDEGRA